MQPRFLLLFCTFSLTTQSLAEIRVCSPGNTNIGIGLLFGSEERYPADGADLVDPMWDIADGTITTNSAIGPDQTAYLDLSFGNDIFNGAGVEKQCLMTGTLDVKRVYDTETVVENLPFTLDATTPYVEKKVVGPAWIDVTAHLDSATSCSLAEVASLGIGGKIVNHYTPRDCTPESCLVTPAIPVPWHSLQTVRLIPANTRDDSTSGETPTLVFDVACAQAGTTAATYFGDGAAPFDLSWDLYGGGTTNTPGATRKLAIVVTDPPKMKLITAIIKPFKLDDQPVFSTHLTAIISVEDDTGTIFMDTVELNSIDSIAILDVPASGTAGILRTRVRAIGSPDMWLTITEAIIDADGNTLSQKELDGVVAPCPTPSGVCANLYRFVGNDPGTPSGTP